jgi:hypothetical protein
MDMNNNFDDSIVAQAIRDYFPQDLSDKAISLIKVWLDNAYNQGALDTLCTINNSSEENHA